MLQTRFWERDTFSCILFWAENGDRAWYRNKSIISTVQDTTSQPSCPRIPDLTGFAIHTKVLYKLNVIPTLLVSVRSYMRGRGNVAPNLPPSPPHNKIIYNNGHDHPVKLAIQALLCWQTTLTFFQQSSYCHEMESFAPPVWLAGLASSIQK